MPTRNDPWPAGTPCWADLAVPDLPAATAFYRSVVGWTFTDTGEEFGHYHVALTRERAAAAIGPAEQAGQPASWTVYLASDDADATARSVGAHGGSVLVPPFDIAGNGRMLVAQDPAGAAFGVWQAGGNIGCEIYNEPGSIVWTDVRLGDVHAGRAFYEAAFGYTYDAVPGAPEDYAVFQVDGQVAGGLGGLMGAPEGTPSHWLPYFGVADVDAAVATAESAGAGVPQAPENTPFGRMAVVTDPFGATFALHGENRE